MIKLKQLILEDANIRIVSAGNISRVEIFRCFVKAFPQFNTSGDFNYLNSVTDFDKSLVLLDGNRVVGIYLIAESDVKDVVKKYNMKPLIDLTKFEGKRGIEGIALGVIPEYQKRGYAKLLKDKVKSLGYDYIFGLQYKSLKNLDKWLKTRVLAAESNQLNLTLQEF